MVGMLAMCYPGNDKDGIVMQFDDDTSEKKDAGAGAEPARKPRRVTDGLFSRVPRDMVAGRDLSGRLVLPVEVYPRMVAGLIDVLLLTVFFWFCVYAYALSSGHGFDLEPVWRQVQNPASSTVGVGPIGVLGFVLLLCWAYFPVLQASSEGATFGMKLLKLRLVRADHERIMLGPVFWRHVLFSLMCVLLPVEIYNLMVTQRAPQKQGFHDSAIGVLVISDRYA